MYTFFIDESESGRYFSVGGYIIKNSDLGLCEKKIANVKSKYDLTYADPIKWSPSESEKQYEKCRGIDNQIEFKKEILTIIAELDVVIIISFVKKSGLIHRKQLYHRALKPLLFRFQYFLDDKGAAERENNFLVLDRIPLKLNNKNYFVDRFFRKETVYHQTFRKIRNEGLAFYEGTVRKTSSLFNTLFVTYSDFSEHLQLADFCVGCTNHFINNKNDIYFKVIFQKFRRDPDTKLIAGYGITSSPSGDSKIYNFLNTYQKV